MPITREALHEDSEASDLADGRSETRSKIDLNSRFPLSLRLYLKVYSSR
jgi:hypothetical protein